MHVLKTVDKIFPNYEENLGTPGRVASVMIGSFLVFNALQTRSSIIMKVLTGGTLIARGLSGYCPATQAYQNVQKGVKAENVNIRTKVYVDRPREEVYMFWRKLENLPLFMDHLKSVRKLDEKHSEWVANIPGNVGEIKWKSTIVKDIANEHIGWQSVEDSTIENAGNVKFMDAGSKGTEVSVVISYHAPGGIVGESLGKMLNPVFEKMIKTDVERFKEYMEDRVTA